MIFFAKCSIIYKLIHTNKKLSFYSIFRTDVSKSDYLEQAKNLKHRQAVAKLRSGNHRLRIETGRHYIPKLPESLRICKYCRSNQIEDENHFLFHCDRYKTNDGGFDDFPKISDHFPRISEDFPKLVEGHTNVAEHFPKITEDCQRLRGRPEYVSMIHQRI